jgi:single-strand DNA-binding protein
MSLPRINGEVARLTQDPELRFTAGGKAVVTVNLAFNKRRKNEQTGKWEDAGSMFLRGTAWEQFAENIAESLSKSDDVIVSGELSMREYERKDGTKGQSLELAIFAIGPNLKTASAKVNRADRRSGSGAPADDQWGSAPASEEPPF